MSGHSKWSTIKHKKGAADAKRGQLFTRLSREIMVAARSGDTDTDMNFRLRLAVDNARSNNMPKENIQRAIERGSGTGGAGESLEEITYEGYGPGGTGIIIQTLTDNKNRSATDVRTKLTRNGGTLAQAGAVAWNFEAKGLITVTVEGRDIEEVALEIVDSGAEDVEIDDSAINVTSPFDGFPQVQQAVAKIEGVRLESAEIAMVPTSTVELDNEKSRQTMRLIDLLEELDDVQKVFTNAEFSEEALTEYAQA
ncbi:MAG: YebC/PmpR family DNA-binding transcriptional regulator [Chloroflexi bacterium]|nr:YebC/PmpR family DNA-binding transcriptional regulator [Chloroflexota bacterium]MDA1296708.1 YebC/PmpR family DNA-binding transcriptional regulator [Chloroflexota bacterium]